MEGTLAVGRQRAQNVDGRDAACDSRFHNYSRFNGPHDSVELRRPRKYVMHVVAATIEVRLELAVLKQLAPIARDLRIGQIRMACDERPTPQGSPRAARVDQCSPKIMDK